VRIHSGFHIVLSLTMRKRAKYRHSGLSQWSRTTVLMCQFDSRGRFACGSELIVDPCPDYSHRFFQMIRKPMCSAGHEIRSRCLQLHATPPARPVGATTLPTNFTSKELDWLLTCVCTTPFVWTSWLRHFRLLSCDREQMTAQGTE
jgi:hypothetical protein